MKLRILTLLLVVFAAVSLQAKGKKTIAVMLFRNDTGSKSLQYLSGAFAESVSTVLSQNGDISVVERNQLATLLKEIELQQTGLFDEATAVKAGKLARADYLILGSYTGTADNLSVSIKLVDISTGKTVDGRMVQAPLSSIFDKTGQAAFSMMGIVAGKNTGYITVTTVPEGCEIWLDGIMIGRSPIVEYTVTEGKHTLMTISSGYTESIQSISVKNGMKATYSVRLIEKAKSNRMALGMFISGLMPVEELLYPGISGSIFFSNIMGNVTLTVEGNLFYGYKEESIDLGFQTVDHSRSYMQYSIDGIIKYTPYSAFDTIMPYGGIMAGFGNYNEYYEKNGETTVDTDTGVAFLAPVAGAILFPHGKFSFFIEGRYYFYLSGKEKINEYTSNGVFGVKATPVSTSLNAASVGLGVIYYFD